MHYPRVPCRRARQGEGNVRTKIRRGTSGTSGRREMGRIRGTGEAVAGRDREEFAAPDVGNREQAARTEGGIRYPVRGRAARNHALVR